MKKSGVAIIIAIVVVAGVVALVVKSNKNDNPSGSTSSDTSGSSTSQDQAVATTKVNIEDMAYSPATITVKKGSTVTWTNKDSIQHTVTGDESGNMDSETLSNGDTYTFTFDTVGTFGYHCNFHSGLTGKVIVTE